MTTLRPEANDDPIQIRSPHVPIPKQNSQTSFENPDGDVDLRNSRFKISRLSSQNQLNHINSSPMISDSSRNRESAPENLLHRSVSSNDVFRQYREPPPLHRTISSIVARNIPPTKAEMKKRKVSSKSGNMVLHLVLPSHNQPDSGHYVTNPSIDEILGDSNRPRSISSQQDLYSMAGTECYVNHTFTNDLGEYRNLAQSPVSVVSTSDHAKSTSPEDKIYFFRKHLADILSSMYAVFIVTAALVVYVSDVVAGNGPISEIFNLYLVTVAFLFILYLTIDIKRYMNKKNRYDELLQKNVPEEIELKESPSGDYHLNIKLPEAIKITKELEHHYCYSKDRHSANFYLKVGAAGFCLGHLIHSGLLLGYQIFFLVSDSEAFYECATVASLVLDIIYPIYSFLLLYFIFKYSNVVINRHTMIARFGLMHCLSSSLCFWVWTILRETIESLNNHGHDDHSNGVNTSEALAYMEKEITSFPPTAYEKIGSKSLTTYLIGPSPHQFVGECSTDQGMNMIYRNYSPYLYPFSVEFSILVVGVLFVIWQSIGKCKEKEEMSSTKQCDSPVGNNDNHESNIVIHVDCHSANKGLFCGMIVMVLTAVSVILFLVAVNDERFKHGAVLINFLTSMIITLVMAIAGAFAYRQIVKLDISTGHISLLDDLLLFICIPAFFLDGILGIVPSIVYGEGFGIASVIIQILQVLIQTPMMIDGLRRCSNSKELRKEKPGRELITFLVVCNLALWLMETFEVKSHDDDNRYKYYGEELWTIIGHLCLPLMMFYRFHSSVCLVDIWKYAYEPSGH